MMFFCHSERSEESHLGRFLALQLVCGNSL